MSRAKTQKKSVTRPKHKHTKDYLKHYYPYLPLFLSIGALIVVVFSPYMRDKQQVLGYSTQISQTGLLEQTNSSRISNGISTLQSNPQLAQAAQAKASDMVTRHYWSHESPDGKEPWVFIASSGYSYSKAGENLAFGFNSNDEVIDGWLNSASHRQNMLDRSYKEVGFGIAQHADFQNSGPATIVVAMYASPASTSVAASTSEESLGDERTIRNVNLLTGKNWPAIAVATISGAGIMYILLTHSYALKKALKKGERFVVRNPLLDSLVIAMVAAGIALLRTAGTIL